MVKATIASKTLHHAKLQRVVAAKGEKFHTASPPVADSSTVKIPFMRTSHTPRTIRLANDLHRHRTRPPVVIKAAIARESKAKGFSGAVVRRPPRTVTVWEEPSPSTFFMDYSGHCHSKLDDGGFLFMDSFGHCHSKLDDGGYLYMDTQGSVHTSLNDQSPQSSLMHAVPNLRVHHPVPRSAGPSPLEVMLSDLSVSQKSRFEQIAHDRELRALQGKPGIPPSHATRRDSKANKNNRRSRSIVQPRKLS